jgi:hypothetical protein
MKLENPSDLPPAKPPEPAVYYVSSISSIKDLASKNLLLWKTRSRVQFMHYYDNGDHRIVLISEDFKHVSQNPDKTIESGWLYLCSDSLVSGEGGIYLLVFPEPDPNFRDSIGQTLYIRRKFNLDAMNAFLDSIQGTYAPCSFWPVGGKENAGKLLVKPPSSAALVFVESKQPYAPVPGTYELIEKLEPIGFGVTAPSTSSPPYKSFIERK